MGKTVIVTWVDAEGSLSWPLPADYSLPIVSTMGWLMQDDEEYVAICGEWFQDASGRDTTVIPRGMVRSITVLIEAPY